MQLTDGQRDWLTLALVPGVGSTHFIRLLARFRTPGAVLRASRGALQEVVGKSLAERIGQYAQVVDVAAQERLMAEYNASLVTMEDEAYPPRLAEIYNPPLVVFVRGDLTEPDEYSVAIVGTRRPSSYGVSMARKLAYGLASRGITVVSGMAGGVDTAAHRGALEAGGRTIAVLGNGVDVVYPRENAGLMHDIARAGAVVSQFAMGIKPSKGHFPYRNRIISGMTLGTVIVEGPLQSGALITARHAAEQGREVFAVPGRAGDRNSAGPHSLIQQGAKLVETVDDILVELEVPAAARQVTTPVRAPEPAAPAPSAQAELEAAPEPVRSRTPVTAQTEPQAQPIAAPEPAARRAASARPEAPLSDEEAEVLSVLSPDGSFVDEIAAACRMSVSATLSSLTLLEIKGLVRQFSGKRFAPV